MTKPTTPAVPTPPSNSTLAQVEDVRLDSLPRKFNGVEMTDVPIPSAAPLGDLAGNRAARQAQPEAAPAASPLSEAESSGLSEAESYSLGTASADTDHTPQPLGTEPLNSLKEDWQLRTNDQGFACGVGLSIEPCPVTTRLKMTLHSVCELQSSPDDPLTRCTFGAVYSPNPTEEDGVFGKYTPFGSLSYNVRSDIAEGLEVGEAYYVDITKVPA